MRGDLVFQAHDLDTLPLGLFAARLLREPLIYDCHENYPALAKRLVDLIEKRQSKDQPAE